MSIFNSISRNIKNVFVGSHKGDDIKDEWFKNPLDSMPIANGTNKYAPPQKLAELAAMEKNPRPEEDMADWFKIEKPDESDQIEEEKKTMHEKMYQIATAKYNPFAVGGSESLGGSEEHMEEPPDLAPSEYEP
tara:strand:- start:8 stop:406 length:399 start_codon:yes stop_codon:yes gene_type:complete